MLFSSMQLFKFDPFVLRRSSSIRKTKKKFRQKVGELSKLSKDFNCVPHDFLPAKLASYGVNESFLCFIDSYLC